MSSRHNQLTLAAVTLIIVDRLNDLDKGLVCCLFNDYFANNFEELTYDYDNDTFILVEDD